MNNELVIYSLIDDIFYFILFFFLKIVRFSLIIFSAYQIILLFKNLMFLDLNNHLQISQKIMTNKSDYRFNFTF